jgi:predicted small lipoprotein YifL
MKKISLILLVLIIMGCGKNGALYLPDNNPADSANKKVSLL